MSIYHSRDYKIANHVGKHWILKKVIGINLPHNPAILHLSTYRRVVTYSDSVITKSLKV
jgi:arginine deiminase